MTACLQPILMPVKGTPDIVLSIDPKVPTDLYVFLGMAMLEKVPRLREHAAFKMLLARLYNAGVRGRTLTRTFGVARSTLRRWGRALQSGDMERIGRALSGQGAEKKITPEIDNYVRDRFRDLHGQCRDYNKIIRMEVKKYFKVSVSSERLRWIFKEEREKLAPMPETAAAEAFVDGGDRSDKRHDLGVEEGCPGANSCEVAHENGAIAPLLPMSRNYSLPAPGLPSSGRNVAEQPTLCHHAGILLMSHWIDALTSECPVQPDLIRQ